MLRLRGIAQDVRVQRLSGDFAVEAGWFLLAICSGEWKSKWELLLVKGLGVDQVYRDIVRPRMENHMKTKNVDNDMEDGRGISDRCARQA